MWNEIIGLLGIRHGSEREYKLFLNDLRNLNDWMLRECPNWTVEEIRLAYNMAIKGDLGEIEVFSILAPKHIGTIMRAYRRYVDENTEVQSAIRSQLLIDPTERQPTEEEVVGFMEAKLLEAIAIVRTGEEFPDLGNGLYDWLDQKGRIPFTKEQKWSYVRKAEPLVKRKIEAEVAHSDNEWSRKSLKALVNASMTNNNDLAGRVRSYAKYLALNDYLKTLL